MLQKTSALTSEPTANTRKTKTPEIEAILGKVAKLLAEGNPIQSLSLLNFLSKDKSDSHWIKNAVGVCQLGFGNMQAALTMFRGMVVSDALQVRTDVPAVFKSNYAVALLLTNNLTGCLTVLSEMKTHAHPTEERLRAAIQTWKNDLTPWEKFFWYTGSELDRPVVLDFPPGDLE